MSRFNFKTILGGTHPMRRGLFVLGACLLAIIAGGIWSTRRAAERQKYQAAQLTARGLVDFYMLKLHWEKLATDDDEIVLYRHLAPELGNQTYKSWSLITPQSDGPFQPQDEFDRKAIKQFSAAPPVTDGLAGPQFMARHEPNQKQYVYYQAITAKSSCIVCHNVGRSGGNLPQLQEGDLIAVAKVVLTD